MRLAHSCFTSATSSVPDGLKESHTAFWPNESPSGTTVSGIKKNGKKLKAFWFRVPLPLIRSLN